MRRIDTRLVIGGLLILGGLLSLLDNFGIIRSAGDVFWGIVLALGGLAFLYVYITNTSNRWALIPAFALLGMAASNFLPPSLKNWNGLIFLGGLGLAFWMIYFTGYERWWAIIPGGVLLTLGLISVLDNMTGADSGGVLFLGLGITFLLVAVLPAPINRSWAIFPAAALLVLGALLGTPFKGLADYIWPAALFIAGAYLIYTFFRGSNTE
jgi:hypothetical protein